MKKSHLFLIWFVALLPILLMRDFTPSNELRYLNIVDEALQNGNIFTFTNQGELYADKPPLHFWLMMAGKRILGAHRMWYYALLSIIPALVIIATMTRWMRRQQGTDETTTSLMLMTTGLFIGVGIIVRMDMLMTMFIVLSLYTFYQMYQGEKLKRNSLLFPLYIFLALFSKGPLGILIPFVSTLVFLAYKKKLSDFPRYWGWKSLAILLTGCLIWFTGVYLEGGSEYIHNLLFRQTVGRGINAFHHKEPFYYYAISSWYVLAPWSLLSIGIFVVSLYQKKIRSDLEQFFAITVLSSFILLSGSEEMHYLGIPLIYASTGILSLTGVVTIYQLYKKSSVVAAIRSMSLGILLSIFIAGWSMPQLNPYLGWRELCEKATALSEEHGVDEFWVHRISRAENMDVYLGKDIIKVEKEEILRPSAEKKLLLLPTKVIQRDSEIRRAIQDKEQYRIGDHTIVIFP